MRTKDRDETEMNDIERNPRGRGHGCGGGSGCCGGHDHGHGRRWNRDDEPASLRAALEERRRDLEQELADVTDQLDGLRTERTQPRTVV
jgi:hypothetical protein